MATVPLNAAAATALKKLRRASALGCGLDDFDVDEFQALKQLRAAGFVEAYPPAAPNRLFITVGGLEAVGDTRA